MRVQRVYLTEARRLGLRLRPPHVNHARREFSVSYKEGRAALYMGLNQVRDLTRETQRGILRERPEKRQNLARRVLREDFGLQAGYFGKLAQN